MSIGQWVYWLGVLASTPVIAAWMWRRAGLLDDDDGDDEAEVMRALLLGAGAVFALAWPVLIPGIGVYRLTYRIAEQLP